MKVATNFVVRLIVLILVFLLGFLSCAGAIVGVAYYAYKNVSVDTFGINTDEYIDREGAEVVLPSMTLEGLVNEYFAVSSLGDEVSIDFLVDRYGLLLPENVDGAIPDTIRVMPLTTVFSEEGVHEVLKCFYIGNFIGLESEEIVDAAEGEDKYKWFDPETGEEANALSTMIANYTFYDFVVGGIDTQEIINELTIAEVMEMKLHENVPAYLNGELIPAEELTVNVWYGRGGAPSETIMSAIADSHINDIEHTLHSLSIMDIMGYVDYNGVTYHVVNHIGENEYVELIPADGLESELVHISLDAISNGELEEEVRDIELYVALGYTKDENGDYFNNGVPVEGFMATVCDAKVKDLEDRIGKITIGEIAGYEKVLVSAEGEEPVYKYYSTYDKDNPANCIEASGIVGALADLTVNDLDDEKALSTRVETIKVSTLLDYKYDEDGNYYYTEDELGNKNEVTGIMAVIADASLNNVEGVVDDAKMADILSYKKGPKRAKVAVEVYKTDENGDYILDGEGNKIVEKVVYEDAKDEHGNYIYEQATDSDGNPIFDGDNPVYVEWYYDENGNEVHSLLNAVARYQFKEMSNLATELSVGDIIPAERRQDGFIKLIDEDTKIENISEKVNEIFDETTIGEFIDAGVIVIDESNPNAEAFKTYYGGFTIQQLMEALLANPIPPTT
ncbi:MAG: hypothetical protein IJ488_06000 [Clostridia bacterium]|nr:hypothetical protein [Clostridia bacterium]